MKKQITIKLLKTLYTFELRYDKYKYEVTYNGGYYFGGYFEVFYGKVEIRTNYIHRNLDLFHKDFEILIHKELRKDKEFIKLLKELKNLKK